MEQSIGLKIPIIGGLSGVFADICTHPISTIKTRMQIQGVAKMANNISKYKNSIHAVKKMWKCEGPTSFFKGIGAIICGAPFASGLYFTGVEVTKNYEIVSKEITDFFSGCIGQIFGSLAWVPMDVIKERTQIEGQIMGNTKKSSYDIFKSILKIEGIRGFYKAYWLHQITWAPFNGIYWMVYERCKITCKKFGIEKGITTFFISSFMSGLLASYALSPIDLVKTRLQVQNINPNMFNFNNGLDCAIKVFKNEGICAFWDGVIARSAWLVPRYCIAISLFDSLKRKF